MKKILTTEARLAAANVVSESFMQSELNRLIAEHGISKFCEFRYKNCENFLTWASYVASRKAVYVRLYMPSDYFDDAGRFTESKTAYLDDWRGEFRLGVWLAISEGDIANAISRGYKAIAKAIDDREDFKSRTNKTLPKEEFTDRDLRYAVQQLCSLNPEGVIPEADGCELSPLGAISASDDEEILFAKQIAPIIVKLFNAVKKSHPYATEKRWKCFEYYVLNVANHEAAKRLGISAPKACSNNREVVKWLLSELEKLDGEERQVLLAHLKP